MGKRLVGESDAAVSGLTNIKSGLANRARHDGPVELSAQSSPLMTFGKTTPDKIRQSLKPAQAPRTNLSLKDVRYGKVES